MAVRRVNFTIEDSLYQKVRAISFIKNKSVSEIIRESLSNFMSKDLQEKAEEVLSIEEENELVKKIQPDKNQEVFSIKEQQIDLMEMSNEMFKDSKPMVGLERDILRKTFLRTSKRKPTLPGRL